jgi:hypothetical protein
VLGQLILQLRASVAEKDDDTLKEMEDLEMTCGPESLCLELRGKGLHQMKPSSGLLEERLFGKSGSQIASAFVTSCGPCLG